MYTYQSIYIYNIDFANTTTELRDNDVDICFLLTVTVMSLMCLRYGGVVIWFMSLFFRASCRCLWAGRGGACTGDARTRPASESK